MLRTAFLAVVILGLAACEKDEDRRAEINAQLPDGCTLNDYGHYRGAPIAAIICDKNASTTTRRVESSYDPATKTSRNDTSFIGVVRK